jgi:hypothetical protein
MSSKPLLKVANDAQAKSWEVDSLIIRIGTAAVASACC